MDHRQSSHGTQRRTVTPEQVLLLHQAKQIEELTDANRKLLALAAGTVGGGTREPRDPEKRRLRGLSLAEYARLEYLPGRNHAAGSATAEIAEGTLAKLAICFAREILLREVTDGTIGRFRGWLQAEITRGNLRAATANKFLRQFRAIWSYAVDRRLLRKPSRLQFFPEPPNEVAAWTAADLAALEAQAMAQTGHIGTAPAAVFWSAWTLVFGGLGSRVTATMLCRRHDFLPSAEGSPATLLLRAETQKQKRDQRIALPPRAAEAVERLLAAHDLPTIFGCWPHDPPTTGPRKWKCLTRHFYSRLVKPAGLELPKGVRTRQFRRTVATMVDEAGGNAQALLGHASAKTTERYKDPKRGKICQEALAVPPPPPPKPNDPQAKLFDKHLG